jgi:hypothetical protein
MRAITLPVAAAFAFLATAASAQTDTSKGYIGAYTPAPAPGAVSDRPVGGPLPELDTGPELDKVAPDVVSTKTVAAVAPKCNVGSCCRDSSCGRAGGAGSDGSG